MKVAKVKDNTWLHPANYFPECSLAQEKTCGYGCPLNLLYRLSQEHASSKNCVVLASVQDCNTVGEQREARRGEAVAASLPVPVNS